MYISYPLLYYISAVEPPNITSHPQSQVYIPIDSTTVTVDCFTVVAMGDNLKYRWQKDGINIPRANSATYSDLIYIRIIIKGSIDVL